MTWPAQITGAPGEQWLAVVTADDESTVFRPTLDENGFFDTSELTVNGMTGRLLVGPDSPIHLDAP